VNRQFILQEVQRWVLKHRVTSTTRELDPIKVVRFIIKEFKEAYEVDPTYLKLRKDVKSMRARWNSKIVHESITFRRGGWNTGNNDYTRTQSANQKKRKRASVAISSSSTTQVAQPKAKRQTTRKKFCLCRHHHTCVAALPRQ